MKAIYGQEVAPGYADQYLGETGYNSQQTGQPVSPDRPDNLFEPVPGDYAARGIFSDRASSYSIQSWVNLHRVTAALMGLAVAGAGTYLWSKNK